MRSHAFFPDQPENCSTKMPIEYREMIRRRWFHRRRSWRPHQFFCSRLEKMSSYCEQFGWAARREWLFSNAFRERHLQPASHYLAHHPRTVFLIQEQHIYDLTVEVFRTDDVARLYYTKASVKPRTEQKDDYISIADSSAHHLSQFIVFGHIVSLCSLILFTEAFLQTKSRGVHFNLTGCITALYMRWQHHRTHCSQLSRLFWWL